VTAEERERRRCAQLVATGKITDAMLVEIREDLVFYSYSVRGGVRRRRISRLVGSTRDFSGISAMSVRYDPRNPANSIAVGEDWAGCAGRRACFRESREPLIAAVSAGGIGLIRCDKL
jgi:hypothetical protein